MEIDPNLFSPSIYDYLLDCFCNKEALKIYSEEDVKNLLKNVVQKLNIPPAFTTIRINNDASNLQENIKLLKRDLAQNNADKEFVVQQHPIVKECLYIEHGCITPITQVEKEVIIDTKCGVAVMRGAHVFVPGILAISSDVKHGDEVSIFVDLQNKCRKGLMETFQGQKLFIGNGVSLISRRDLFVSKSVSSGIGIRVDNCIHQALSLSSLQVCDYFPQNLPSLVCVRVLNPQPGDIVLDMCAAPGGKTTHMGLLMKNQGKIIALDKSKNRIKKVKLLAEDLNLHIIETYFADSTNILQTGSPSMGVYYEANFFDKILLDAPCSGLGRRPLLTNELTLNQLKSFPTLQKKLIATAVSLLKEMGTLVYSTCTLCPQENELNVSWALKQFPNLHLSFQEPHIGGKGWPVENLNANEVEKLQRFLPTNLHNDINSDTNAFFIAKFYKDSGS